MIDILQTIFGTKSITSLLFGLAIIVGIFLNSLNHDRFIGYHPEKIKSCTTHVLSLPCSPAGWSFLLIAGAFIAFKFLGSYKRHAMLTSRLQSLGIYAVNYLDLFDPLRRCLRRGIICRLVYY